MRVVIAEDQVLLREGLARLFADRGHQVAASLGDARELVATVAGHRPDLVVVDIRMPPTFTDEGPRAAYEIKQKHPQVGVLLLSQHIETKHAIELVTLGGFGYLLKDRVFAVDEFLDAAERVARGGSALDPHVVGRLLGHGRHTARRAVRPRAPGTRANGRRSHQRRHRRAPFRQRAHRRDARAERTHQAQHPTATTAIAECWPWSRTSARCTRPDQRPIRKSDPRPSVTRSTSGLSPPGFKIPPEIESLCTSIPRWTTSTWWARRDIAGFFRLWLRPLDAWTTHAPFCRTEPAIPS